MTAVCWLESFHINTFIITWYLCLALGYSIFCLVCYSFQIKRQLTLFLSSGNDQLLPNKEEGKRLRQVLEKCEIRNFRGSGHFLFLVGHDDLSLYTLSISKKCMSDTECICFHPCQEDGFDLVSVLKGAYFYRRGTKFDYVSDFMPVTHSEFNKFYGRTR